MNSRNPQAPSSFSPDLPTCEDKLGLDPYTRGLTEFIIDAATPMTLAIQGDWGSGKTSTMSQLKASIERRRDLSPDEPGYCNAALLWINTWEYAQFNMQDDLPVALITHILRELERISDSATANQNSKKIFRTLETLRASSLMRHVTSVGMFGADMVAAGLTGGAVTVTEALNKRLAAGNDADGHGSEFDQYRQLGELKQQFRDFVESVCQGRSAQSGQTPERVVIFIDDLDRLPPERAVEVMEAIKNFLDCPRCIFVLAIDFEIVSQGLKAKYGENIPQDRVQVFFDKIIQVPFNMPESGDTSVIVADQLNAARKVKPGNEALFPEPEMLTNPSQTGHELITCSVASNPRAAKRLANTYTLTMGIYREKVGAAAIGSADSLDPINLLAVLCMQVSYPDVYRDLRRRISENNSPAAFLRGFLQPEGSDEKYTDHLADYGIAQRKWFAFARFMGTFMEHFHLDDPDLEGYNDHVRTLKHVVDFASILAVDPSAPARESSTGIDRTRVGFEQHLRDAFEADAVGTKVRDEAKKLWETLSQFNRDNAEQHAEDDEFPDLCFGTQSNVTLRFYPNQENAELPARTRITLAEVVFQKTGFILRVGKGYLDGCPDRKKQSDHIDSDSDAPLDEPTSELEKKLKEICDNSSLKINAKEPPAGFCFQVNKIQTAEQFNHFVPLLQWLTAKAMREVNRRNE
ncbi:P-loop NTPase fold protein [Corynebacterium mendelii]